MHFFRWMAIAKKANVVPRTCSGYHAHPFSIKIVTKSSSQFGDDKDEKFEKPAANFGKEDSEEEKLPKLLRIPRAPLEEHTYMYSPFVHESLSFRNKLFRLVLRPIKANLMTEINNGPTWLQGDYPMGLLKGAIERRRYLKPNVQIPSGWRELEELNVEKKDRQQEDIDNQIKTFPQSYRQSSLIKRPLLANGKLIKTSIEYTPLHDFIPVLVVVGKKSIDNRAVIRNKVRTKLLFAFQNGLKQGQSSSNLIKEIKWPLSDSNGNPFALIFFPSKQVLQEPMSDLIQSCKVIIESIAKRIQNNPTFLSSQQDTLNNKTHHSFYRSQAKRRTTQNQSNKSVR